jgi:hypothetical protein
MPDMPEEKYVHEGVCTCCHLFRMLDSIQYCEECTRRLEKQEETGRCGWCGRPVLECVCDDDYMIGVI